MPCACLSFSLIVQHGKTDHLIQWWDKHTRLCHTAAQTTGSSVFSAHTWGYSSAWAAATAPVLSQIFSMGGEHICKVAARQRPLKLLWLSSMCPWLQDFPTLMRPRYIIEATNLKKRQTSAYSSSNHLINLDLIYHIVSPSSNHMQLTQSKNEN